MASENIHLPQISDKKTPNKKRAPPPGKPSKEYIDFLNNHYVTKENPQPITNTRIGDKDKGGKIPGGSFHIPDAEYATFLRLYGEDIIRKGVAEHLTEKQLENGGPILIDIDLHYEYAVTDKQYELWHIEEIVDCYLGVLKTMYQFDETTRFLVFVQEKDAVNRVQEKTSQKMAFISSSVSMPIARHNSIYANAYYPLSVVKNPVASCPSSTPGKMPSTPVLQRALPGGSYTVRANPITTFIKSPTFMKSPMTPTTANACAIPSNSMNSISCKIYINCPPATLRIRPTFTAENI